MKNNNNSETTTLDLIESCLDDIYRIRSRSLLTRSKHYRESQQRQQQQQQLNSPDARKFSSVSSNLKSHEESDDDEEDDEDVKIVDSLASKRAPEENVSLDAIYDDFQKEYSDAISSAETMTDDEFEDLCSYLIEKYFSQKLDKLPVNPQVSSLKKLISSAIEQLASARITATEKTTDNSIPNSTKVTVADPPVTTAKTKIPANDNSNKKPQVHFSEKPANNNSNSNNPYQKEKMKAESKEKEQQKIKHQYETFMKTKKAVVHQDAQEEEAIREYEKLTSEIHNVLSSINPK
jgi:hypothetical protein